MAQETRTTDIFGPKLVIETGNPQMGSAGRTAFTMQSTTDKGIRFIQSHSESGMSIRIGYEQEHKTKDIKILGQSVDVKSQKGNLADILQTSSFLKTFMGSPVFDLALKAIGSPLG